MPVKVGSQVIKLKLKLLRPHPPCETVLKSMYKINLTQSAICCVLYSSIKNSGECLVLATQSSCYSFTFIDGNNLSSGL